MGIAGVRHVITVDLHASQMQGFFKCPVDNLHAEPLIARWIRHNVPNWKEGVVVSKNAGGTKRVTSLADALKLNFGIVTTDKKRGPNMFPNMTASMIMNHLDGFERQPMLESMARRRRGGSPSRHEAEAESSRGPSSASPGLPARNGAEPEEFQLQQRNNGADAMSRVHRSLDDATPTASTPTDEFTSGVESGLMIEAEAHCDDGRAGEVTQGRLIQGHIVDDDFPSPTESPADTSQPDADSMTMSHSSSFFAAEPLAFGGSGGEDAASSDEEEETLKNPKIEHMITLVGNVRDRPVFIVDDMIDKPGSWIAAAETVVKRGGAQKVYCMATHGVFGGDCLAQLQACECIDAIIVTNSFPINEEEARRTRKLAVLDLSFLLAEAIRRNHHGESISALFQHYIS
jgi:ribose-phosphate pyrophosphokinase